MSSAIHQALLLVKSVEGETSEPLPTRLLDLRSPTGTIRLVEPEDGATGKYATLSYRWGDQKDHVTTTKNLTKRLQELDLQGLPVLFLDAIRVCKDTGLKYLWIDSLCILQDSGEDWKRESKLMGNIYAQSTFTIAAHSAKSSQESFLKRSAAPFEFVSMRGMDKRLWNIRLPRHFEKEMVCASSISSRGWVLQERLLSQRLLHFLPSAVYLETRQGVREMDSVGRVQSAMKHEPYDFEKLQVDPLNPSIHWQSIVSAYSKCRLTNDGDKLPALAGIASRIQKQRRFDYIAGLWLDQDLISQLLWFAPDGRSTKRPKSARAPSLSWASLDGPVKYLFESPAHPRMFPAGHYHGGGFSPRRLYGPDDNHLRDTPECRDKKRPYWIEEDVHLLFRGALIQLPKLGSRWIPTTPDVRDHSIWWEIIKIFEAVDGIQCCRPLQVDDDVLGIVILDEDPDDCSSETVLWCVPAATEERMDVALVVSENDTQKGTYRRAGVCLFFPHIRAPDGCSFLTDWNGMVSQPILFT